MDDKQLLGKIIFSYIMLKWVAHPVGATMSNKMYIIQIFEHLRSIWIWKLPVCLYNLRIPHIRKCGSQVPTSSDSESHIFSTDSEFHISSHNLRILHIVQILDFFQKAMSQIQLQGYQDTLFLWALQRYASPKTQLIHFILCIFKCSFLLTTFLATTLIDLSIKRF